MVKRGRTKDMITLCTAAQLIGMTRRSVDSMVQNGVLSVARLGSTFRVYREEVMHLKALRDRGMQPRYFGEELVGLKYQMSKVMNLLQDICAVLKITNTIVTFTDAELIYWYDKCNYIKNKPVAVKIDDLDIPQFHSMILNINEEELRRLKILKGDPIPYAPFLGACERIIMNAKINKNKTSPSSIKFTKWIHMLVLARNALRDKAIIYTTEEPYGFDAIKRVDMAVSMTTPPIPLKLESKKGSDNLILKS